MTEEEILAMINREVCKLWILRLNTDDFKIIHNFDFTLCREYEEYNYVNTRYGDMYLRRSKLLAIDTMIIVPSSTKIVNICPTCGQEVIR